MADSTISLGRSIRRFAPGTVWTWRESAWIAIAVATAAVVGLPHSRSAIALVAVIAAVSISAWKPGAGLSLLVASVPIQDAWPAQFGGFTFTWTRLLLFCFLIGFLARSCTRREMPRLSSLSWAMLALVTVLIASVTNARDVGAWAAETYRWGVAAAVLVVASAVMRNQRDRRWLLAGLGAGIVFSFAVAICQVWTHTGPETFDQRGWLRAYGLFGEPNPFAVYLEIALLPFVAIAATAVRRAHDAVPGPMVVLSVGLGALGIVTTLLTQSRGGLLGLLAGLLIIAWRSSHRIGHVALTGAVLLGLLLLVTTLAGGARNALGVDAFKNGPTQVTAQNFAVNERIAHWGAAFRMWQEHPLLGVGAGNVSERFREVTPEWRFRIPRGHAHNNYLQAAAQAGSIGLICYLAVFVAAWRQCHRRFMQATTTEHRAVCTGALAVTGAMAVHGLFEYTHVLSLGVVLSAIWASTGFGTVAGAHETTTHGYD